MQSPVWRWIRPWMVGVIGVAASFGSWRSHVLAEERALRAHLELHATERVLAVQHALEDQILVVEAVGALFAGAGEVAPEEFRAVAQRLGMRAPGLRALSWNPAVRREDRADHEAAARTDGLADYEITEGPPGALRPAAGRPFHFVVRYIEPLSGNRVALGYDVGSEPRRRAALERAAATGKLSLTERIELVQDDEHRTGFLAFFPLYQRQEPGEGPHRLDRLEGVIVGVFHLDDMLAEALASFDGAFRLRIVDVTGPAAELHTGRPASESPDVLLPSAEPGRSSAAELARSTRIDLGGRTWELQLEPTAAALAAGRTYGPARSFGGLLLATAAAVAYFAGIVRRTRRVETLVRLRTRELQEERERLEDRVAERTAEIVAVNEDLSREIAQRKQAESARRQSEERVRLTLDAVSDGGWDWNLSRDELHLSDEWYASIGHAPDDFAPWSEMWREFMHPEDQPRFRAAVAAHLEGRTPRYECEMRLRTKAGDWRWFRDRGAVVERDVAGNPLRFVGTHTDVTEQKRADEARARLEARMHHGQKLESLGVLAGGIAHDFNNLLVGVLANAELALMKQPPGSTSRADLEEIRLAARRASELTHQLLAYAGKARSVAEAVDLSRLVEETAQLLRASISDRADLRCDFQANLPAIRGDPSQIRQVAMNLITNASDALGGDPGVVGLRTGVVRRTPDELGCTALGPEQTAECCVFLEVSDTGCGMDAATQARIFDPFFTTKFYGRGLGLAAALGIVRRHGGAIELDSNPDFGTTFRVLFPCATGCKPSVVVASDEDRPYVSGTVLVVDDEPGVQSGARGILEQAGLRVLVAATGSRALDIFKAHADEIDVVLLDLTMPQMSGREVMQELRGIRPDVRILASSGWADETSLAELGPEGPAGFLAKPYGAAELLAKVAQFLPSPAPRPVA